jgi:hypothetical protein
MVILPLVVRNMGLAYRISVYIIYTQVTRVTDMQCAISSKYKGSLLYLLNKRK